MDNYILLERIINEKGIRYSEVYDMAEKYYFIEINSLERKSNIKGTVAILEAKIGFKKTYEFLDFLIHQ